MAKLKVRMLVHMAGPDHEVEAGSEHDLDADEAQRLIDAEFAEAVQPKRPRGVRAAGETATRQGRQTAAARVKAR